MYLWVASYPRSGSNFTVGSLKNLFGFKNVVAGKGARSLARVGLPTDGDFFQTVDEADGVFIVKTHQGPRPGDQAPTLHVVRDGRDCVVSHTHYLLDRQKGPWRKLEFERALTMVILEGSSHGNWSANARAWMDHSAPTATVYFEELIQDAQTVLRKALESVGVPVPRVQGEVKTFAQLHKKKPMAYRRGKAGGWRDEMSPELEDLFWRVHGEVMEDLGYSR